MEESRSLPQDMVAELVERILLASHSGQEAAHSKVWSATVHKRIADIRAGKMHGIPWEKTSEKIKRIVGR